MTHSYAIPIDMRISLRPLLIYIENQATTKTVLQALSIERIRCLLVPYGQRFRIIDDIGDKIAVLVTMAFLLFADAIVI